MEDEISDEKFTALVNDFTEKLPYNLTGTHLSFIIAVLCLKYGVEQPARLFNVLNDSITMIQNPEEIMDKRKVN